LKSTVLIVEDESIVAMEIASFISQQGFHIVGTATNADDAYKQAIHHQPDIILMDINLKGGHDGIDAALKIQTDISVTIIYITAFSDEETIERAVATHPAAYLTKPFNRSELLASIKIAQAQRRHKVSSQSIDQACGDITLDSEFSYDLKNRQLLCCCEYVHLTRRESELLYLLINSKNSILSIYEIENTIWPDKPPMESTRRALISRLRTKLKHQFIETIPSIGYRLNL
jgi:DNA-binding response OmpR family regulator